jgi:hypothetical protein
MGLRQDATRLLNLFSYLFFVFPLFFDTTLPNTKSFLAVFVFLMMAGSRSGKNTVTMADDVDFCPLFGMAHKFV